MTVGLEDSVLPSVSECERVAPSAGTRLFSEGGACSALAGSSFRRKLREGRDLEVSVE